ncbi:MAG: SDR family oxidoreductase [Betaproteobacteria bacterium]|nr:SDR family oxidoreductase [Betaproteobacteria bacterium]
MVVFLTGASSGIGEALARQYAARGATLGLVARRADLLDRLCQSLPSGAQTYVADVRDIGALQAAAADFVAKHGVPDLVIANAGISHGTITENAADIDVFRQILDINVIGMVNTFHPFVDAMRKAGRGKLVGVASVAGYRGLPGAGAYSASKAAAIRYCESLRVELRGSGVKVVTICPGYIATPMTAKNPYPMPFIITADDFARRFARAVEAGKDYAVIPWQMAIVARLLTVLPNFLFDATLARTGRKPRKP